MSLAQRHLGDTASLQGAMRGRLAFSLIEVMVSIGIIAILIEITVPALMSVRVRAGEIKSLSNLRGIGLTMENFLYSNKQHYPFYHEFDDIYLEPPGSEGAEPFGFSPAWWIDGLWPGLMHEVAPWRENYATWLSPGLEGRDPQRPWTFPGAGAWYSGALASYRYCNSFIAKPIVWSGAAEVSKSNIAPIAASEVLFPSKKVLMFDYDRSYLARPPLETTPRPLLFADDSASSRLDSKANRPVQNPLYINMPARIYHDTRDGVLGRDF